MISNWYETSAASSHLWPLLADSSPDRPQPPFRLQQATKLLNPTWQDVLLQPSLNGDLYSLVVPVESGGFYRLGR